MDDETAERIRKLEYKLERYHRLLESCVDHDRKLLLAATWGIVTSTLFALALFGGYAILEKWLGWETWWGSLLIGTASLILAGFAALWCESGQKRDLERLSKLPEWDEFR